MNTDIHVVPVDDLREHVESGRECWCQPRIETRDPRTGEQYPWGRAVIVHNSEDGREHVERHGVQ
jgi:hypothetical protein